MVDIKNYSVKESNNKTVLNDFIIKLSAECSVGTVLYYFVGKNVSADNATVLIIIYNFIVSLLTLTFGIIADNTENRATGVKLGAMLLSSGFLIPVSFSITLKVVLSAIGMACINGFAGCNIIKKSEDNLLGIGTFFAFGLIGMAIGRYLTVLGYLFVCVLMLSAAFRPNDIFASECKHESTYKNCRIIRFLLAVLLVASFAIYVIMTDGKFIRYGLFKKDFAIICIALSIGRLFGDIFKKILGNTVTVALSLVGGFAFLAVSKKSVLIYYASAVFLGMFTSPIISSININLKNQSGLTIGLVFSVEYIISLIRTFNTLNLKPSITVYILFCLFAISMVLITNVLNRKLKNENY